jgi:hypothetical protein
MVKDIRITYRRRCSYATPSNKIRAVKTPGVCRIGGAAAARPFVLPTLPMCASPGEFFVHARTRVDVAAPSSRITWSCFVRRRTPRVAHREEVVQGAAVR